MEKKTDEYYDSLSDEDKKIMDDLKNSLKPGTLSWTPEEQKKMQIEKYVAYLDGLKKENRIGEEEYQKMLLTIKW